MALPPFMRAQKWLVLPYIVIVEPRASMKYLRVWGPTWASKLFKEKIKQSESGTRASREASNNATRTSA